MKPYLHFLFLLSTCAYIQFFIIFLIFRAVKFTSKLFGRALSRRIKATILYATETGKSEQYAKQLVELLGHAFNAQVIFKSPFVVHLILFKRRLESIVYCAYAIFRFIPWRITTYRLLNMKHYCLSSRPLLEMAILPKMGK